MSDNPTPLPSKPDPAQASMLGGLNPEELLARGMQSVRMTGGGGLTDWSPPTVTEAARLFPNYEVLELIGRGGMGAVYKARQLALDRSVAVKLLPLEVSVDRDFADRFVREARTMARMNHPNIVSVFDFGTTTEGHLYFIMEFVEGTTLHHLIKTVGLKPEQALEIIATVCEALAYAHGEGVVHRDIKPANVLVDMKGRVKVTDFGLARLNSPTAEQWGNTMTGAVLGTPDYMAPEQKRGMKVDHRADIYSLGVMLYEMLCGQVPQGIFDPPSQRVRVDARVDQVVIRAMQQEPDRRYHDTAEMKTDVETIRVSADHTTIAPVPRHNSVPPAPVRARQPAPPPAERAPKNLTPLWAGIAVVCVSAAAIGGWFLKDSRTAVITPAVSTPTPAPVEPASTPAPVVAVIPVVPVPVKEPEKVEPIPPKPPVENPAPVVAANPIPVQPEPAPPMPQPVATAPQLAFPPVGQRSTPRPPVATPAPVATMPPQPAIPVAIPVTDEWRISVLQGDNYWKARQVSEAIESYEHALDVADTSPQIASVLERASLCRKLGVLQINGASPAEARDSFNRGKKLLQQSKGKTGAEGAKLLQEIDNLLLRTDRD